MGRGQIAILSALLADGKTNVAEKRRNLVLIEARNINTKASYDCGTSTIVARWETRRIERKERIIRSRPCWERHVTSHIGIHDEERIFIVLMMIEITVTGLWQDTHRTMESYILKDGLILLQHGNIDMLKNSRLLEQPAECDCKYVCE